MEMLTAWVSGEAGMRSHLSQTQQLVTITENAQRCDNIKGAVCSIYWFLAVRLQIATN